MKKHYDVAITGFWYGANYGSLLNGYAMYHIIKSFGKEVLMIQKPGAAEDDFEITQGHNTDFVKKYYDPEDISPALPYSRLGELNDICDCFCAGSDQIWNYPVSFGGMMFMPFANDDKKIISFSTSFGNSKPRISTEENEKVNKFLHRYSAISVREQFSVDLLRDKYAIKGDLVFEPVFCIDRGVYDGFAANSDFNETEPYLLTYILDPTPEKWEAIQLYAQKLGLKIINIPDGKTWIWQKREYNLPNILKNVHAEDFLKAYKGATYVITDSFHGTAFSIIFQKPFLSIGNYGRGFERFVDLLGRLKLTDRLVSDPKNIPLDERKLQPIDYTETNIIIEQESKKTVDWVRYAVETPKDKLKTTQLELPPINKLTSISSPTEKNSLPQDPDLERCRMLASLMRDYGIKHVVLSSGTRHVNLVRFFEGNDCFKTYNVVDERSAGFFAIGLALKLKETVAICCTSGTAASNYISPVTEAFYQNIPLLVITSDRYPCLLNQQEQQMVPQMNIFNGIVKKSVQLPVTDTFLGKWETRRMICDCLLEIKHRGDGPVHIDVPINNIIRKSLGSECSRLGKYRNIFRIPYTTDRSPWNRSIERLKSSHKILLFWGQSMPLSASDLEAVNKFAHIFDCAICTDYLSNIHCDKSIHIYNLMTYISKNETAKRELAPDIFITVGGNSIASIGSVVSLANNPEHWNVLPDGRVSDPYRKLYRVFECTAIQFIKRMNAMAGEFSGGNFYYNKWMSYMPAPKALPEEFSQSYAVGKTIMGIPEGSDLCLANSNTVRMANNYNLKESVTVYCNRGTNGIDGSVSTFMGMCAASDKLCFMLTGDLGFFYDLNSLWNKELKGNIRIMLFNNGGTSLLKHLDCNALTHQHNAVAEGWVKSLGFSYLSAKNIEEFNTKIERFISKEDTPMFFEVFT